MITVYSFFKFIYKKILFKVFTDIIGQLLKAPLNDMNDFKVVGDALAIFTQNFGQLLFQDQV